MQLKKITFLNKQNDAKNGWNHFSSSPVMNTLIWINFPYRKNCFINQYQISTGTSKKYTRTSIKHTGFGIILILVNETFPIELQRDFTSVIFLKIISVQGQCKFAYKILPFKMNSSDISQLEKVCKISVQNKVHKIQTYLALLLMRKKM